MRLAVGLDNRGGNATAVGQVVSLFLRPGANLRILQALRRVTGVAAAAGRPRLTASLNVGLNRLRELLEVGAVQINFVRRTIECETHGLICGGAVEIVDDFHNLLRLLHDVCPFREKETGNF